MFKVLSLHPGGKDEIYHTEFDEKESRNVDKDEERPRGEDRY